MALFAARFCCWLRCAHMQLKIQHNNQQELVNAIKAGIDWCVTKISTINMNNTERTQRNNNQPDGHERYVSSKMLRSHTPHKSSLEHPSQIIYSFVCLSQRRKKTTWVPPRKSARRAEIREKRWQNWKHLRHHLACPMLSVLESNRMEMFGSCWMLVSQSLL